MTDPAATKPDPRDWVADPAIVRRKTERTRRRALLLATIVVLLPFLALVPGEFFNFILPPDPSTTFLLTGAIFPVLIVGWLWRPSPRRLFTPSMRRAARAAGKPLHPPRKDWSSALLPVLAFLLFWAGSLNAVALLRDVVSGHPETSFATVRNPRPQYVSFRYNCRGEIDLVGLLVGRLCGFPQRFRDDLRKGEKLRLDGTGTAWGLFVHNVTAVQG